MWVRVVGEDDEITRGWESQEEVALAIQVQEDSDLR